jgi:hypothetical protein
VSRSARLLLTLWALLAAGTVPGCRADGSGDEDVLVPVEETAEYRVLATWVRERTRYADVRVWQTKATVLELMGKPNRRYRSGRGLESWAWWPTDGEGRIEIHFGRDGRVERKQFGLSWAFR